jgi:glycine cleavage system aminomethyltransferase T
MVATLTVGKAQYSLFLPNSDGGNIDDLIIYV